MLEFRLIHDNGFWVAENPEIFARGRSLKELDCAIKNILKERDGDKGGLNVTVRMTFDNSVLPQWMRQYSNHYFNRVVVLDLSRR